MGNHEPLTELEIGIGRTDVIEATHETFHEECKSCMYGGGRGVHYFRVKLLF